MLHFVLRSDWIVAVDVTGAALMMLVVKKNGLTPDEGAELVQIMPQASKELDAIKGFLGPRH